MLSIKTRRTENVDRFAGASCRVVGIGPTSGRSIVRIVVIAIAALKIKNQGTGVCTHFHTGRIRTEAPGGFCEGPIPKLVPTVWDGVGGEGHAGPVAIAGVIGGTNRAYDPLSDPRHEARVGGGWETQQQRN